MKRVMRYGLLSALMLALPGWASAGATAATTLPALLADGVQTDVDLRALERQLSSRQTTVPLAIYVGHQAPDLKLRRVSIAIDDAPALVYEYSDAQSTSLAAGALQRLARIPLDPGRHHLVAEFVARKAGSSAIAPPVVKRVIADIEPSPAADALRLSIVDSGMFNKADLTFAMTKEGADLASRYGDFLDDIGRPVLAMAEYLDAQPLSSPAQLRLGELRMRLGISRSGTGMPAAPQRQSLVQYNHALEAFRQGRSAEGLATLEQLVKTDWSDPESLLLKDLANVTLGYRYLHARDPDAASTAFSRVRSPGPYSNQALLGFGWAHILPLGAPADAATAKASLWPDYGEDDPRAHRLTPFRYVWSVAGGEREKDLNAAMAPWTELIGGDPLDAAVQEGMLTVPYALSHLGAYEQAQRYYARAIKQLEDSTAALTAAIDNTSSGQLVKSLTDTDSKSAPADWRWHVAALQYQDNTAYLRNLLDDARVTALLDDTFNVQSLSDTLHAHQLLLRKLDGDASTPRIASALQSLQQLSARVDGQAAVIHQQLQQAVIEDLQQLRRQTASYLAEAHLALAGMYDRGPQPELAQAPESGAGS